MGWLAYLEAVWDRLFYRGPKNGVRAPFTEDQVDSLNGYQAKGFFHPFTCGRDHDGNRTLIATHKGWVCPTCSYTQKWAHGFMADWSWKAHADALTEKLGLK